MLTIQARLQYAAFLEQSDAFFVGVKPYGYFIAEHPVIPFGREPVAHFLRQLKLQGNLKALPIEFGGAFPYQIGEVGRAGFASFINPVAHHVGYELDGVHQRAFAAGVGADQQMKAAPAAHQHIAGSRN